MSERAEFHVMGQPLDGQPLHYTASGLDYVYLLNGFNIEDDADYGPILTIQNEDNLHRAIGLYVITRQRALTSAEFRFLRKQMGLRQKELASKLGVNEQTVANYEKNKRIPASSENWMRMIFLLSITPGDVHAELLKRVSEEFKKRSEKTAASTLPSPDIQNSIAKQWQIQKPMTACPVS